MGEDTLLLHGRGQWIGSRLGDAVERRDRGQAPRALALVQRASTAVVGLALWSNDPLWPGSCLVDLYCHPHFWDRGPDLLAALVLPGAERCLAYADADFGPKTDALAATGFRPTVTLKRRVAADRARTGWVDVEVWEK